MFATLFQSMVKYKKERKPSSDEESESESNSESDSESEEEVHRPRKLRKRANSESDSDEENDINAVMKCLPDNSAPLIEFANVSQGILLLLMLKQHLKNLCGFSDRYGEVLLTVYTVSSVFHFPEILVGVELVLCNANI